MYFRVSIKIFIFRVCIVYFANCLIVYFRVFNILKIKYSTFKLIHLIRYNNRCQFCQLLNCTQYTKKSLAL